MAQALAPSDTSEDPPLTVQAYLELWLGHARGRIRAKSYEGYEGMLRLYASPAIGARLLADVNSLAIQRLYGELLARGLSGGTVLNLHLVLTQSFGQAVRWGLLAANPVAGAQPPRPRRPELAIVDPSLAGRILQAVGGTPLELPAAVAIATGMRRGEILALRWSDFDAELTTAYVRRSLQNSGEGLSFEEPKTRRSRRAVALPDFLRPYLEHQRQDQAIRKQRCSSWTDLNLVMDRGDGQAVNPDTLSAGWAKFLLKAGLPHVRFHDLRHAHATLMLLQGVHPKVVSERLGHASVGITLDTYSHVLPTMQTEAARAFDRLFGGVPTDETPGHESLTPLACDSRPPVGAAAAPTILIIDRALGVRPNSLASTRSSTRLSR